MICEKWLEQQKTKSLKYLGLIADEQPRKQKLKRKNKNKSYYKSKPMNQRKED